MLAHLDLRGLATLSDLAARLPRPTMGGGGDEPVAVVRAILADVRERGDAAVREYTARFDGAELDDLAVPAEDLKRALDAIPSDLRQALETARSNIDAFHRAEAAGEVTYEHPEVPGLRVRTLRRPVDRAGCYVPGGRAVYPSTLLMTAVPARAAGVGEVVVCVPPDGGGRVPEAVLAAAALAEIDALFRVGGAQAVAAMAYGTESIPKVDVIVGPGNIYVAIAKREVAGDGAVSVPASFAGPSEVVVVADDTAPADAAAIDLIVQAEHGPDGLAWLITWSPDARDSITETVTRLTATAPRQAEIEATLRQNGYAVLVNGPDEAIAVANLIAPEHLQLMTSDPEALVPLVRHAGAVFLGPWAPASIGDYVAGPNHVLPTFGSARFAGALTLDDFTKPVHVIEADKRALETLAPHVQALATAEGLAAHAESVRIKRA
ncbi:MAG: histidinol dehydrogenase [Acidimicrobiales bacterium]